MFKNEYIVWITYSVKLGEFCVFEDMPKNIEKLHIILYQNYFKFNKNGKQFF